jgi:hypothetical protein
MRYPNDAPRIRQLAEECKFLPTVADVVNWCEARAPTERIDYSQAMFEGRKQDEALAAARLLRPTLKQLHERHGKDYGIKGSEQDRIANEAKKRMAGKTLDAANAAAIAVMDKAYGWDTAAKGYTPMLVEVLKRST